MATERKGRRDQLDWTVNPVTGRSNDSAEFVQLCGEVASLLRSGSGAGLLSQSWIEGTARLIMAQLAHVHKLAPEAACSQTVQPGLRAMPKTLLDGAVTVEPVSGLRNKVGEFMWQRGINMGDKLDAGHVQDLLEEWALLRGDK